MPITYKELEEAALKAFGPYPEHYVLDHELTADEETILENRLNNRAVHYQYVVSHRGVEVAIRRRSAQD